MRPTGRQAEAAAWPVIKAQPPNSPTVNPQKTGQEISEISDSIRQLESIGLSGHKILIEGLKTGTANVQSKLLDPYYKV